MHSHHYTFVSLAPKEREPGAVSALIAYVILMSVLPSRLVVPGLGAAGRPASLVAVGLLLWWILAHTLPAEEPTVHNPIRWVLSAYLFAHMAAVVAGLDRGVPGIEQRSMDRFVLVIIGIAGVILVSIEGLRSRRQVERVMAWVVALGALSAVVGIVQFAVGYNLATLIQVPGLRLNAEIDELATRGSLDFRRAEGFTLHSIELGVVMGSILPIALYLGSARSTRWYLAAALIGGVIPFSITRTGVLAFATGMSIYALGWTWRQRLNSFVLLVFGAGVYSAVAPGLLGTLRSLFVGIQNDNSTTGRTEDFDAVARYIRDRPHLGRGPGTFIPGEYRLLDNAYLLELIEAGWVGLISLLALLITPCVMAFWLVRRAEDPETRALARTLGGAILVSLIGFATYDAMAYPTMLGVLSLAIGSTGALYRLERLRLRSIYEPDDNASTLPRPGLSSLT